MTSFYTNILPIIVIYNQRIDESHTMISINAELQRLGLRMPIFVYDNSPISALIDGSTSFGNFDIHYYHDKGNSGLSVAYNKGADCAKMLKKKWILLLDQDTKFENLLSAFITSIDQFSDVKIFAPILKLTDQTIFSPIIPKHKRGYAPKSVLPGINNLYKLSPVNSGLLISTKLFHDVGGYDIKIKVDFCDFQFLEKVRAQNPIFVVANTIGLQEYSAFESSFDKQYARFRIYINDAISCNKPKLIDKIGFLYTVTRHTFGLTWKLKSPKFLVFYAKNYLFR